MSDAAIVFAILPNVERPSLDSLPKRENGSVRSPRGHFQQRCVLAISHRSARLTIDLTTSPHPLPPLAALCNPIPVNVSLSVQTYWRTDGPVQLTLSLILFYNERTHLFFIISLDQAARMSSFLLPDRCPLFFAISNLALKCEACDTVPCTSCGSLIFLQCIGAVEGVTLTLATARSLSPARQASPSAADHT